MSWHGHLALNYRHDGTRTVVADRHTGPLRILQSLYPEGAGICHNVLVHPPAGIAGGDVLGIDAHVQGGAHAFITTPGATRFYRSTGEQALQTVAVKVDDGARLEWLPLETLCYPRLQAENRMSFSLAPDAEMIGWDVLALGLPASNAPFDAGRFTQEIRLGDGTRDTWLERGTVDGTDQRLLQSPLGWAGRSVMATMWFAAGSALPTARRDTLLADAREAIASHALAPTAGATSPHTQVVVVRALAHRVEPAMQLLTSVWTRWRKGAWDLPAPMPRIWRV
ncbi:urease accessory protein UreD [Rhizobacter sp. Root1221]|uniref:urease accessory protein UreD n=1 Tax=Rhizobacter sp. Root1221 TaxID=1736433 RepID=UPI0006F9C8A0|nr:urease accessory protein UreD [Rhizobacter sp. Root1221]KQV95844.1 urease accessory protein ureD [Rhizobacter sp. Root1221]